MRRKDGNQAANAGLTPAEEAVIGGYSADDLRRLAQALCDRASKLEDQAAGRSRVRGPLRVLHAGAEVRNPTFEDHEEPDGKGVEVITTLVCDDGRYRYFWHSVRRLEASGQIYDDGHPYDCTRYLVDARYEARRGEPEWRAGCNVWATSTRLNFRKRPPSDAWAQAAAKAAQIWSDYTGLKAPSR